MIEIKITGATPQELFDQLAALAGGTTAPVAEEAPAKPKKNVKKAEAPKPEPTAAEPEPTAAEPEEAEEQENTPAGDTEESAGGEVPSYTFVDIRAKGIEAAGKYGQPAVKAILTELEVKGMSELKEDQFAAFVEKLEGLGDSNA